MKILRILRKVLVVILILGVAVTAIVFLVMQQPSFGKLPAGERLARIEKSSHYKNNTFQNLVETPMYPENTSTLEVMTRFVTEKDEHNEPENAIPFIKRNLKTPPATSGVVITWFGHSTALIQMNGKNILTDPQFSERASPVGFAGPKAFRGTTEYTVNDLPEIDAVLISHDHYDHLDYNTILKLKDHAKAFFVPLGVAAHLEYWGIPVEKIHEVDWWQQTVLPDSLTIVATPSRHFSGRGLSFNKTSWGSYVVILKNERVFFSGDSGYEKHFKMIGDQYGPFNAALIETGQYDALWPNIHMMPEQSVQAAFDLRARKYVPIHWSKFALALHAWKDPITRAEKKATELNINIVTPKIGEAIILDSITTLPRWWEKVN